MNSSAELTSLKQGEMIHSQAIKTGYESDICVCGSLIDMYSKNGLLKSADWVFRRVKNLDLKCWNAMLSGYGNHGDAEKAFKLFDEITTDGLNPDVVTFVSLLSACTHCCLVEKGKLYWNEMVGRGLVPEGKHYACMVNLLGRAGLLDEAEKMIVESLFAEKLPELWRILLSSAVGFKDLRIGIHAAERVLRLDPDDSSSLVMLSKLYACVGRWEDICTVRRRIREIGVDKDHNQSSSWLELD